VVVPQPKRAWPLLCIVLVQIAIAATMLLTGFPSALQVAHVAVGAGVWRGYA
jgi:heme A synthase